MSNDKKCAAQMRAVEYIENYIAENQLVFQKFPKRPPMVCYRTQTICEMYYRETRKLKENTN